MTALVLLGLTVLTFVLARVVPSNPAALYVGPRARPEEVETARRLLGLNKPLYQQYFIYLYDIIHGDFGISIRTKRPVIDDLRSALPASIELITASLIIALVIGLPLGIVSANERTP